MFPPKTQDFSKPSCGNGWVSVKGPEVLSPAEPVVTAMLGNGKLEFLIDTGAGYLVLNTLQGKLSDHSITTVSATGICEMCHFFNPMIFKLGKLWRAHHFLYLPNSPKPLLGENLLEKLNAIKY